MIKAVRSVLFGVLLVLSAAPDGDFLRLCFCGDGHTATAPAEGSCCHGGAHGRRMTSPGITASPASAHLCRCVMLSASSRTHELDPVAPARTGTVRLPVESSPLGTRLETGVAHMRDWQAQDRTAPFARRSSRLLI